MNPAVTNLVLMLGLMQVAKKIPFDDPNTLTYLRIAYVVSNVIILSLYAYVGKIIAAKNDQTTLKYVEPAPPMSGEPEKQITTTICDYDQTQLKSAFKGTLMGMAIMCVMHFYMGYTNPLFMQSIMPLKSAFENNLVKIHVFGKPASGALKRPFKAAGMFAGMGGGEVKTDKKSVEQAEKSGRGGAKEE